MASNSYPRTGYAGGEVVESEYEALALGYAADGIIGSPADSAVVYADGTGTRVVKIRAGKSIHVRGSHWFSGATDISLPSLAANSSGTARIDLVVARYDRSTFRTTEYVITGSPGAGAPALVQNVSDLTTGIYDFPIAQITVDNGATAITAGKVKMVGWFVTPTGGLICTSDSRPYGVARTQGLEVWDSSLGTMIVWDGTDWRAALDSRQGKGTRDLYRLANNSAVATGVTALQTIYDKTVSNSRVENGRMYAIRMKFPVVSNVDFSAFRVQVTINNAPSPTYRSGYVTLWKAGYPLYWDGEITARQAANGAVSVRIQIEATGGSALSVFAYADSPFEVEIVDTGEAVSGVVHT